MRIAGESRTSTAVIDPTGMTQTEINEWGPVVTEQEREAFLDKIDYLAKGAHYVIICGSLPRKVPDDFYAEILSACARRAATPSWTARATRCATACGPTPTSSRPTCARPKTSWATSSTTSRTSSTPPSSSASSAPTTSSSRRADGCYARIRHGRRLRVYHATIPLVESVVSTVGSGDAFLAGFVAGHFSNPDPGDCLRYGLACGAANTQHYGAGVLDPDDVEALLATTKVDEIRVVPAG